MPEEQVAVELGSASHPSFHVHAKHQAQLTNRQQPGKQHMAVASPHFMQARKSIGPSQKTKKDMRKENLVSHYGLDTSMTNSQHQKSQDASHQQNVGSYFMRKHSIQFPIHTMSGENGVKSSSRSQQSNHTLHHR